MLNKKLFSVGSIALITIAACSSDETSTAGATIEPNAIAENDSIIIGSDNHIDIERNGFINFKDAISFKTEPVSLNSDVDNLEINVYNGENGASASCAANDQSYDAKIKITSQNYVLKQLQLKNVGSACDSILQAFMNSCNKDNKILGGFGHCTDTGDLQAVCADLGNYVITRCDTTDNGEKKCYIKMDSTIILDTNSIIQEFTKTSENTCTYINASKNEPIEDYWTPGHNPIDYLDINNKGVPIDTSSFTLEKYETLFAEAEKEFTFDSHVIAYRIMPTSQILADSAKSFTIKEAKPAEVAKYFPMTTAITGEKFNPEFCNIYTIITSGFSSMALILTDIKDDYENVVNFAFILASGECNKEDTETSQVFLIKDCDGILFEGAQIGGDIIENTPWTCDENGVPPGRENGPYGEWYRADLRQ